MSQEVSRNLYDDVFYPGRVYEHTHPNRLAAVAAVYGMDPAPPERCRVLELGCGAGANISPMAFQYPHSEFIGIDRSGATIARGNDELAALGLKNIRLVHCDILDVDQGFGKFDYILAHGVYAWVPPDVRDRMMAIFKANLSPQGVCYVSYNAHPFSHMRNLARDMMLFHTRHLTDMKEKVAQSRAIMKFLSEAGKADSVHGSILRDQYSRVMKMRDEVLFHDDLNELAEAFLLHEVVEHGARHGLQYLSDAEFARRDLATYPEKVREVLQTFPDSEFAARDQYQDFIDGNGFRRTLFCHGDLPLRRKLDPECFRHFHLLATTEPVSAEYCLTDMTEIKFRTQGGSKVRLSHPLLKAAYLCLGRAWPGAFRFEDLLQIASRELEGAGGEIPGPESAGLLLESLFVLAQSGEVGFLLSRPTLTTIVGDRPVASLVARRQVLNDTIVTNLLHQPVRFGDDHTGGVLQFLDGSRTFDDLVAEIRGRPEFFGPKAAVLDGKDVPDRLREFLKAASKLGLLIG
jgi:SAM-dependent methyltransferase